jgi:hypothetical protein
MTPRVRISRRVAAAAAIVVVAAPILVLAGRHERDSWISEQGRGLEQVRRAIGQLDSPTLHAFRVSCATRPQSRGCPPDNVDCLAYRRGANPLALELCVDQRGFVVEVFDRRFGRTRFWSLRRAETSSPVRVDRREVDRLLTKMNAFQPAIFEFKPRAGPPGTVVTLTGRAFAKPLAVEFGGVRARVVSIESSTRATAVVPPGAKSGRLSAVGPRSSNETDDSFTVTSP